MMNTARKTLSLSSNRSDSKSDVAAESPDIEVGFVELALPCRVFEVDYKVSSENKFSPSAEFFLRLVHSASGIERHDAASFFGYNEREIEFVVKEAEIFGYVSEVDGRLSLTLAGSELFGANGNEPRLFSVTNRTSKVCVDSLSLAPARRNRLLVRSLPELQITKETLSLGAAKRIQTEKLKLHFAELGLAKDKEGGEKTSLYSVDNVVADARFQEAIPVSLTVKFNAPSIVSFDLSEWRPDHEIADRMEVERQVSKLVDTMKVLSRNNDSDEAYDTLLQFFPEYLDRFTTRKGLNVERFWRDVSRRDPVPQANRKTIPIVGPLFTARNSKKLNSALDTCFRLKDASNGAPDSYIWIAPQLENWGASSVASKTNDLIKKKLKDESQKDPVPIDEVENVCFCHGERPPHLRDVFDSVINVKHAILPREFELLLVPDVVVFASVHAPVSMNLGFPTPLGVLSFEKDVVSRVQELLYERLDGVSSEWAEKFRKPANNKVTLED
jgi:hypothetical protein